MLKLHFNQKALEATAKQMRAASWSVSASVTLAGFNTSSGFVMVGAALIWVGLQALAFVLDSVKESEEGENKNGR